MVAVEPLIPEKRTSIVASSRLLRPIPAVRLSRSRAAGELGQLQRQQKGLSAVPSADEAHACERRQHGLHFGEIAPALTEARGDSFGTEGAPQTTGEHDRELPNAIP